MVRDNRHHIDVLKEQTLCGWVNCGAREFVEVFKPMHV